MNELEIFKNEEFGEVRVLDKNGDPWFVGRDVCEILEVKNVPDAMSRLDDDEKLMSVLPIAGQNREVTLISESGLYSIILRSRKPEAKKFKKWITSEVLPSIRKTGGFSIEKKSDDEIIQTAFLLLDKRVKALENKVAEDKPKVEFYDAVTGSDTTVDIGTVAKVLNIPKVGRTALFAILRNKKILMPNNQPYQSYVDRGYFRVIESKFTYPSGDIGINFKTVVYQKGVDHIRKIVMDYLETLEEYNV